MDPTALKVLIVDDDPDTADTLALLLGSEGSECRAAYSGEQAIRLARSLRPDLLIVDLAMPGVDGFEVARRLRGEAGRDTMRLVAHTSLSDPDEIEDALEAGFDRLLVKPASVDELLSLVSRDHAAMPSAPTHLDHFDNLDHLAHAHAGAMAAGQARL